MIDELNADGDKITQICCGHSHSACLFRGEIFMWGSNPDCRLMIETEENSLIPAQTLMSELRKEDPDAFEVMTLSLGVTHSVVITRSGEVFSAGSKLEG